MRCTTRTLCLLMLLSLTGAWVRGQSAPGPFAAPEDDFDVGRGSWRGRILFAGVDVIPMSDIGPQRLVRRDVLIEDGWISAVRPAGEMAGPAGTRVVAGDGRTLLPGLIDTHVHVWMGDGRYRGFDEGDLWTLFLANGITAVKEMVGADPQNRVRRFLFDWRDDVALGRRVGPTLFIASPRFRDEYHGDFASIDAAVREYAAAGYDSIKVHAPNRLPNYLRLFEQAALVGIRPIGHPPYRSPDVPVETVLELQTMVSHTQLLMFQAHGFGNYGLTSGQMQALAVATAEAGTWLQPTLMTNSLLYLERLEDWWAERSRADWLRFLPPPVRREWVERNDVRSTPGDPEVSRRAWEAVLAQTGEMHAAGVPMLAGSDSGGIHMTMYGFTFVEELLWLAEIGLTPHQALRAATAHPADFLEAAELGRVEAGRRADLLLVEGDPLADLRALTDVAGVMVRGKWITGAQLGAALEELAARMGGPAAASLPLAAGAEDLSLDVYECAHLLRAEWR